MYIYVVLVFFVEFLLVLLLVSEQVLLDGFVLFVLDEEQILLTFLLFLAVALGFL